MLNLTLPPPTSHEVKPKRPCQSPDFGLLKSQQAEAAERIKEFLDNKESRIFRLAGYAGTGKTYLMNLITEHMIFDRGLAVAFTAPTNKAVKVAKRNCDFDPRPAYKTIHSLLGLREQISPDGKQMFVQSKSPDEQPTIQDYNVVIIDEASMLPDELLLGRDGQYPVTGLLEYAEMFDIKLICVGDPAQIPPVNTEDGIIFRADSEDDLGMETYTLTDVLRQAADNPIIAMSMRLRDNLQRPTAWPARFSNLTWLDDVGGKVVTKGVSFVGGPQSTIDASNIKDVLAAYFTSDNFKQDGDFAKVIAWTNATVNKYNKAIRQMLYGAAAKARIVVGEKLIANRPVKKDEETMAFNNNDEFEVVSFKVTKGSYKGAEIIYYDATVKDSDSGEQKPIKIVHEDSLEDYKLILDHLRDTATQARKGSFEAAEAWQAFYRIQEYFADVNYNYAITAHKSQGSTYFATFVLEFDMDKNRDVKERNRIKYTAATRPSTVLFVLDTDVKF